MRNWTMNWAEGFHHLRHLQRLHRRRRHLSMATLTSYACDACWISYDPYLCPSCSRLERLRFWAETLALERYQDQLRLPSAELQWEQSVVLESVPRQAPQRTATDTVGAARRWARA